MHFLKTVHYWRRRYRLNWQWKMLRKEKKKVYLRSNRCCWLFAVEAFLSFVSSSSFWARRRFRSYPGTSLDTFNRIYCWGLCCQTRMEGKRPLHRRWRGKKRRHSWRHIFSSPTASSFFFFSFLYTTKLFSSPSNNKTRKKTNVVFCVCTVYSKCNVRWQSSRLAYERLQVLHLISKRVLMPCLRMDD